MPNVSDASASVLLRERERDRERERQRERDRERETEREGLIWHLHPLSRDQSSQMPYPIWSPRTSNVNFLHPHLAAASEREGRESLLLCVLAQNLFDHFYIVVLVKEKMKTHSLKKEERTACSWSQTA